MSFQLPLSGSRVIELRLTDKPFVSTFNSLSRDHEIYLSRCYVAKLEILSTPSLGITPLEELDALVEQMLSTPSLGITQ